MRRTDRDADGPERRVGPTVAEVKAVVEFLDKYMPGADDSATRTVINYVGHATRRSGGKPRELTNEERAARLLLRDARAERRANTKGYIYLIGEAQHNVALKIGYSVDPEARLGELQTGNPRKLVLLAMREGTPAQEHALHVRFGAHSIINEWFEPTRDILEEFDVSEATVA